ncbi:uncharacterized protein RHOBADRAFT_52212 [Rhodotorula graminis WP1]|uniref:Uncharacterized protein n=1 Tax=Rhodotorula graminis (strain WP1) TaxID=578459 RepID=A0A194S613_RHOGW|nr:uncharacterized protein RHOBADRAFT_52212 [Rhodotorula graminis WP1]KPV76168.1 hypothetical protein RHOBADRAFT_52212 [Rhodotorula graminis WP1]
MSTTSETADTAPQGAQEAASPVASPIHAQAPSTAPPPQLSPTASSSTRSRFFATASSRPFSRSALQRQSVHTLPSIHHLQHGFAKLGLLAQAHPRAAPPPRRTSSSSNGVLQPLEHESAVDGDGGAIDELGPQPDKPVVDLRMPWERDEALTRSAVLKDEAQLRSEAYEALDAVCDCWSIAPGSTRPPCRPSSSSTMSRNPSTASAITPMSPADDTSFPSSADDANLPLVPTLLATTTLAVRAIQAFAVSLPSPPAPSRAGTESAENPLIVLRRTSLDVLGMLREIEARYRLPGTVGTDDAAVARPSTLTSEAGDDQGARATGHAEVTAPHGDPASQTASPEPQYRVDVELSALEREAALVERWLGTRDLTRGGPPWRTVRAYAIMVADASASTAEHALPDPADDWCGFLDALSDGTLLLESFNNVLRHSPWSRPFGFVPSSSIHVFPPLAAVGIIGSSGGPASSSMSRTASAASDGGERVGATFRRAENLGQWSAALKHRYALSLGPPPFDIRLIAARRPESAAEWREMLAGAVEGWAGAVASEASEVESERQRRGEEGRASGQGSSE